MDASEITASRITVVNSRGEPAIVLDGGDEKLGAMIVLTSQSGAVFQITEQPGGHITLSTTQAGHGLDVTIGAHGITVNDRRLLPGIHLGNTFWQSEEGLGIAVFRDGHLVWSSPAAPARGTGEL